MQCSKLTTNFNNPDRVRAVHTISPSAIFFRVLQHDWDPKMLSHMRYELEIKHQTVTIIDIKKYLKSETNLAIFINFLMLYFWTVASLAVGAWLWGHGCGGLAVGALMRTTAGLSMVGLISSNVYFVEWTRLELQTDSRRMQGSASSWPEPGHRQTPC